MKNNRAFFVRTERKEAVCLSLRQLLIVLLAICLSSIAFGQAPTGTGDPSQPYFYPAPPAGFNAVTASDADLATYGFPPRPSLASASYTTWANMVTGLRTRLPNPTVKSTGRFHAPPINPTNVTQIQDTNEYSDNWSGLAANVSGSNNYFKVNTSMVGAGWQLPALGTENCSYTPYYIAEQWVGFDGWNPQYPTSPGPGNQDVLQAGVELSGCPSAYVAWYTWYTVGCTENNSLYPCDQTNVNLPISAGQYFFVWVIYEYSDNPSYEATAVLSNQSTGQYVSIGFNQPPSNSPYATFSGESAEWIVERPMITVTGVNGGQPFLPDLANYASFYMGGLDVDSPYWDNAPDQIPNGTLTNFTMTCPPWTPASNCPTGGNPPNPYISTASYNGVTDMTFTAVGPALQ
jgi:hypothetical protein